eukprot:Gb_36520 [translate_table: standard]
MYRRVRKLQQLPTKERSQRPATTKRNFLKSLPDEISCSMASVPLTPALRSDAILRHAPSEITISGIRGGDLFRKTAELIQMNKIANERISTWQIKVSKGYSMHSNRIHITVAPARTLADICLFLHSNKSAVFPPPKILCTDFFLPNNRLRDEGIVGFSSSSDDEDE